MDGWIRNAEPLQFLSRFTVTDTNHSHFLQHIANRLPRLGTAYGTDALGIEHDRLVEKESHAHDEQIIIETAGAGHILQQTSTTADEKISPADSPGNARKIQPVYCLYMMIFPCHIRVSRNDRDGSTGNQVLQ